MKADLKAGAVVHEYLTLQSDACDAIGLSLRLEAEPKSSLLTATQNAHRSLRFHLAAKHHADPHNGVSRASGKARRISADEAY